MLEHLTIPKDLLMPRKQVSNSSRKAIDEQDTRFGDPKNSVAGLPPGRKLPKSKSSSTGRSELREPDYLSQRHHKAPKSSEVLLGLDLKLKGTICEPLSHLKSRRTIDDTSRHVRFRGTIFKPPNHFRPRKTFTGVLVCVQLRGVISTWQIHHEPRRALGVSLICVRLHGILSGPQIHHEPRRALDVSLTCVRLRGIVHLPQSRREPRKANDNSSTCVRLHGSLSVDHKTTSRLRRTSWSSNSQRIGRQSSSAVNQPVMDS